MLEPNKKNKFISSAVILGHLAVYVLHPALLGVLFGSGLVSGKALAEESDSLYKQLQSQYNIEQTDNDVAKEDQLEVITSKYGKGTSGTSVSTNLNKYATSTSESRALDMSKYGSVDFSGQYQSTYNEAAAGGIGVNRLQQPGVSGSDISINYSSTGTSTLSRSSDGTITSTQTGSATTHTLNNNQLFSNESDASDVKFKAGTDYNPDADDALIDHTKERIQDAATAQTSDAVSYRTLNDIRTNNYPQTISRSDQIFTSAKASINEALTSTGDWSASCTTGTTYSTKTTHYASWQEHICQTPKKDNYQSCKLERDLGVPVYLTGGSSNGSLSLCGDDCVLITVGQLIDDNYNGGSCRVFPSSIYLHFTPGAEISSATLSGARWDDHIKITLGGEDIFTHVWRAIRTGENVPVPTSDCETSTSWYLGNASGKKYVSGAIDVTGQVQAALNENTSGVSIPFKQEVAVGDGGEGYSQIKIIFKNMKFGNTITQTPAGCYDELQKSNGICHVSGWTPIEQGTRMYPDEVLAYGKDYPLYPGDTGYLTWSANADGYYCDPLANTPLCMTDNNGVKHCYNYETIKNLPDGCADYANNSMCSEKSRVCVPGWYDSGTGQCYMQEVTYSCDEGTTTTEVVKKTTNTCGDLPCIGTDCAAGTSEANSDFSKTAAMLNALSFMGADSSCGTSGDVSDCKIFPGELKNCGWAVGIAGSLSGNNCCEAPGVGPNMMSAAMTAYSVLKRANWDGIIDDANSSMNSMTDGAWTNVTNAVTDTAESAYETASSYLTDAYDTIAGNVTEAATEKAAEGAASDAAKTGLMEQAQQKAMGWAYDNVPFAKSFIEKEAGEYALTTLGENVMTAVNVVMIAYTAYQIAVMIAQLLTACEQEELETASKISQKSCFKTGGVYCSKEIDMGFTSVCVKRSQRYCCYSSMLPRIIMQQAVQQLPARYEFDCSGLTVAQLQQLDWSKIDLTEWIAAATQEGIIPDGAEDLTLEALTGNGAILGDTDRQTTTERLSEQYGNDALTSASDEIATQITPNTVDCSYLPRPAICKLQ